MRPTHWGFLALGVAAMVAYPFSPPFGKDVLYLLSSMSVVLGVLWGIRTNRPVERTPWLILLAAFSVYLVGDVAMTILENTMGDAVPFPSPSDIPYLLFYPVMFVAIARFLKATGNPDRAAWVDASIWTVGAAVLLWEPLIEPYVVGSGATPAAYIVAMAYPLLDLGLLLMVLRMLAGRSSLHPSYVLLTSSIVVQVVIDFVYGVRVVEGTYVSGEITDTGWMLINVLMAAAALHPSMVKLTRHADQPTKLASRRRLQALLAPALLAPGLLVFQVLHGNVTGELGDVFFAAAAAAVFLVLVVSRGEGLLAVAEFHADELRQRTSSLEVALVARETASAELRRRVDRDTLTGLASRDYFVEVLKVRVASWQAGGPRPSIAFLDLDDFKTVNDSLGHEAGDLLLVEVAHRLRESLGPSQVVARFGGDEFALIIDGDADEAADRLVAVLRPPLVLNGRELRPGVSIGVTTAGGVRCSPSDMLREADVAMYVAKRAGGGWARYQSGMSALVLERLDLQARLVEALQNGEIESWFQPFVDINTGDLVGFEALARWCRAGQSVLVPDEWFGLAEETGLVTAVDRTVLRAAIAQLAVWRREPHGMKLDLAVNVSGRTLQQQGIEVEILDALRDRDVPPDRLIVEVTEGVLIDDDLVGSRLQHLRAAGVRIALDDFGTGWASLSYLRKFPVDQIKVDRSFTAELGIIDGADAIPAAIMQLAQGLSLEAVVEGVETPTQRERLVRLGFRVAQGHLFGRALRGEAYDALVRSGGRRVASATRSPTHPATALRVVK